ncbi:MAG: 3'-5' exonuclease, partial [Mariprofundaceae bacterium]|nr:3'-5' exonuclease [Mariprofundaceae bacterium]
LTAGWQEGEGRHRTLFMVGDPMQSIYRFRKAEVGLFFQAAANQAGLPPVETRQLERNFRSASVIVDWVNAAFGSIFPDEQDIVRGAVAYAMADATLSHQGCVRLHIQTGQDDVPEAEAIVHTVCEELAKPSYEGKPQRIGILARSRKHLHAIMPALHAADIPFRAINILPLDSRPEIRTLRALMRALLHPADRESWAALLRAPCCGLTTADMFALMAGDERCLWEIILDENALSRLEGGAQARVRHIRQALLPCMAASGKTDVRRLVESAWLRLGMADIGDETASLNVAAALSLIEELDEGGHINFALFDERLEQLFAAPDASADAARVELLTMHGAKGLQWDVVILPGLGKTTGNSDAPMLAFAEVPVQGDTTLLMAPKAPVRGEDILYSLVQGIEKSKADHELARLLYVACTRAETSLYMFGHVSEKSGKAANASLLALLLQGGDDCFGAKVLPLEVSEKGEATQRVALTRIRTLPAPLPDMVRDEQTVPEYGWAGPEAAPVGNAVHAALQQVAEKGVESWTQDDSQAVLAFMRRLLIAEGLSGELLVMALRRCKQGLERSLASEKGQWVLSGRHADAHCEWALSMSEDGDVSHHVIDRSFVDKNGVRWIVDYKTGFHEGKGVESFLDHEQERHAPQLVRYARVLRQMEPERPLRAGLYFPLLDGWREVELSI